MQTKDNCPCRKIPANICKISSQREEKKVLSFCSASEFITGSFHNFLSQINPIEKCRRNQSSTCCPFWFPTFFCNFIAYYSSRTCQTIPNIRPFDVRKYVSPAGVCYPGFFLKGTPADGGNLLFLHAQIRTRREPRSQRCCRGSCFLSIDCSRLYKGLYRFILCIHKTR